MYNLNCAPARVILNEPSWKDGNARLTKLYLMKNVENEVGLSDWKRV